MQIKRQSMTEVYGSVISAFYGAGAKMGGGAKQQTRS